MREIKAFEGYDGKVYLSEEECKEADLSFEISKRKEKETLLKELLELDKTIQLKYWPGEDVVDPEPETVYVALAADIESAITKNAIKGTDPERVRKDIIGMIKKSKAYALAGDNIINTINFDVIMKAVNVRTDLASALKSVKKGWELSGILGWSFSNRDLVTLGELHRKNRFRKKIEDLLTDCNFHYECGLLLEKDYETYFKEVMKDE